VYKILQSVPYPRYCKKTKILKIGMSKTSLQNEILNHIHRHTVANRLIRIQGRRNIEIFVQWCECNENEAVQLEIELLKCFEDKHWDLPVLNSKRGYMRGADEHYAN